MKKSAIYVIIIICVLTLAVFTSCNEKSEYVPSRDLTVVLLNGEHYWVRGSNSVVAQKGEDVTFEIDLDKGYEVYSSFGDDCGISDDVSFSQTVTFKQVNYNFTVQLYTRALDVAEFNSSHNSDMGTIEIESCLGEVELNSGMYYTRDILNVKAVAKQGFRFECWSYDDYIEDGGSFFSHEPVLEDINFTSPRVLYANFRDVTNTKNVLVYNMGNGYKISHDCTAMLNNNIRANTFIAADVRKRGVDCDSRLLVGWQKKNGEFVGLGSRVATADTAVELTPVWKEFNAQEDFQCKNGVIIKYMGSLGSQKEIVIPNKINGEQVVAIGANAFENCNLEICYLPDTITAIADKAFLNCLNLKEIHISDNILNITDYAFEGCCNLTTLYINAVFKPRFVKEQVSVVANCYDKIALCADEEIKKFIVLGGSGVQAGYSCSLISQMLEEKESGFEVFNLGWSAAYSGLAQFQIVNKLLRNGDIFLHAPEHYKETLCGNLGLSPLTGETAISLTGYSYFYRLAEFNWQFASYLTVKEFSNVFSTLAEFNRIRLDMKEYEYYDCYYNTTTEGYGYRPTNEQVFAENGQDRSFAGARDILEYVPHLQYTKEYMYKRIASGVKAYVTFPAVNLSNLLLTYGDEDGVRSATNEYTLAVYDLVKDINVTVLLTQYDTVYEGRYFYNHDYHLGYPCRDLYTKKVISALIEDLYGSQNEVRL